MHSRVLNHCREAVNEASPQSLFIYSFIFLILLGTILLSLPIAHSRPVGIIDAFFISTSASCVTGLATVDMVSSFNWFGELVILLLIQFGGVGVMTFAAVAFKFIGTRLSFSAQGVLEDAFYQNNAAKEFKRTFYLIFALIIIIEFFGALALFFDLIRTQPFHLACWTAVFHSVSAFCNAGFARSSESLTGTSVYTQTIIMILIIFGGLGHVVLVEFFHFINYRVKGIPRDSARWFSYHVRVVLVLSAVLIIAGTVTIYLFNYDLQKMDFITALFQSVTTRTAGFNTIDLADLRIPSILIMMLLMIIGGSPCSCAGGIKTTTLAVWLAHIKSMVRAENEITFMGMKIPHIIVVKAAKLVGLALLWNILGLLVLSTFEEDFQLGSLLFEQISAFATVGLSIDLTPGLCDISKLWLIITMFVGRVGPLTIALALPQREALRITHPEGRIMVG